jgi:hypothetical protein
MFVKIFIFFDHNKNVNKQLKTEYIHKKQKQLLTLHLVTKLFSFQTINKKFPNNG